MKKLSRFVLASMLLLFFALPSKAQNGFVVLNEYLPWPGNGCPDTIKTEFIEIMNFGPGPVDLGCYVVTDGDYAITIPPNSFVQPGDFFVLGSMNTIPMGCANIDSAITVDLNWNTCNCTSAPIPTTGDAFLTDGGSANEQVVLLDPSHTVIDAIVRKMPQESSSLISLSTVGGQCTGGSFNLDSMNVQYEIVGESAGRGNSFARKLDGDCGWLKDTQQSGNATNNTSGNSTPTLTSSVNLIQPFNCPGVPGAVSIGFSGAASGTVFPAKYILAYDADNNLQYTFSDTYSHGTDSVGAYVELTNLATGNYRIAIEPATGCNYQMLDFSILACGTGIVPVRISQLAVSCNKNATISWVSNSSTIADYFEIEATTDDRDYFSIGKIIPANGYGTQQLFYIDSVIRNKPTKYRVKMMQDNGIAYYSNTIGCNNSTGINAMIYPNPARHILNIKLQSESHETAKLCFFFPDGQLFDTREIPVINGLNTISIPVDQLSTGGYFVRVTIGQESRVLKFLKQ